MKWELALLASPLPVPALRPFQESTGPGKGTWSREKQRASCHQQGEDAS